jgi:hypothetical protein
MMLDHYGAFEVLLKNGANPNIADEDDIIVAESTGHERPFPSNLQ